MNKIRAAVVGLGQIGQGYDYDRTDNRTILTHARAYAVHEGYELVAATDTDAGQRERFTAKFDRPVYADAGTMMLRHHPEIVSLCVPTDQHLSAFREVVPFGPRVVLCEKPMSGCSADAREMIRLAEMYHCVLTVNYIRRFEPGALAIKERLDRGEVGAIEKGICWYSKGILNNGSHYIDLLRFLLGDVKATHVVLDNRQHADSNSDPDTCLHFAQTPVYFLSAREECFSLGKIELMGTGGQILYDDFGETIRIRKVEADSLFPGYRVLKRGDEQVPTDMGRYQWHVVDHLYRYLTAGGSLMSDGRSAAETLAVIEKIKASWKEETS
jgi:predicted dehydrogenase